MLDWDKLAKNHGYNDPRDLIVDLYYRQNMSDSEFCRLMGISRGAFYNCLRRLNLPAKGKIPAKYVAGPPCPNCGHNQARIVFSNGYSYGYKRIKVCRKCKNRFTTLEHIYDKGANKWTTN